MRLKEHFINFDAQPISSGLLHGPITDEMLDFMHQRNEEKLKASIEFLGAKWLLHPDNKSQRKEIQ
jgi:hypothetical protein